MKLLARKATTPDILTSRPFSISTPNTTVLRMERGVSHQTYGNVRGSIMDEVGGLEEEVISGC